MTIDQGMVISAISFRLKKKEISSSSDISEANKLKGCCTYNGEQGDLPPFT